MIQCPSCGRLAEPSLQCSNCSGPLPANVDLFTALGLPRKLTIAPEQLEATYHRLGRELHPDRFAAARPEVRRASLTATSLLTRAYRTLRDPISRANYWLELHGRKARENGSRVPADVAEMVFDIHEELAEFAQSRNAVPADASDLTERVNERRMEIVNRLEALDRELAATFCSLDQVQDAPPDESVAQLLSILSRRAYLRTLLRDIEKALDTRPSA